MGVDVTLTPTAAPFFEDWSRADQLSRSYADRWLRKAAEADRLAIANRETQGSLERIAVTESSGAFSVARADALEMASVGTETRLMRVWDATLDRRTCPACEGADGSMVGIRESFAVGEPGTVHPFCRCMFSVISVTFKE